MIRKPKLLALYSLYSICFFVLSLIIYIYLLVPFNLSFLWILTPQILYWLARKFIGFFKLVKKSTVITMSLVSLIMLFVTVSNQTIYHFFEINIRRVSFFLVVLLLISIIIFFLEEEKSSNNYSNLNNKLFNIIYINISKVYEIVMLIDNKIKNTIEQERSSEKKRSNKLSAKIMKGDTGFEFLDTENTANRVYENFEVKTTKSILLRKIYNYVKEKQTNELNVENLNTGDMLIFNRVTLNRLNVQDTIFLLQVATESMSGSATTGDFEININEMMNSMLKDFTIDYEFEYDNKKFLIQIPFQNKLNSDDNDNFEKGYGYNDLQLGKLNVLGIYRGEIDFTHIDTISSKFIEQIKGNYNSENNDNNFTMADSSDSGSSDQFEFEFDFQKLEGKYHLIDLLAVIQELQPNEGG